MKKGILIIAVGHKNYEKMAINLAASIRVNDPGLQIALATDGAVISTVEMSTVFDKFILVKPDMITHKGQPAFIKAKLHMLDLSPFDETIFLDADQIMIANRSLMPVFDSLKDIEFTMSNTGLAGGSIWADIAEVNKLYGPAKFWNYHSEFVYFKKTAAVKKYFKTAQKVFQDNKIKSAQSFGGAPMADELAFQCASIITGIYPHTQNWLPNFWFDRDHSMARKYTYELTDYITYSIGGNYVPPKVKANYLILAQHYFKVLGLRNPYQVIDKMNFLTNRKTV